MTKHKKQTLSLLIAFFFILIGLGWLAFGLLLIGVIILSFNISFIWARALRKNTFVTYGLYFFGIFALVITLRVFIFEIFTIPSGSMKDTLVPGDKIIVSKLNYGPKLPKSPYEIPWVNVLFYINKEANRSDSDWWDYHRLSGYTEVRQGDVVVFVFPGKKKRFYIKRCVGTPGDTFEIKDGNIFIDGMLCPKPGTVKNLYRIWAENIKSVKRPAQSLSLGEYLNAMDMGTNTLSLSLSRDEMVKLLASENIDSIKIRQGRDTYRRIYPKNADFDWTLDNFGPLVIPSEGMTIALNPQNFACYRKVFHIYEGANIQKVGNKYYLNNKETTEYTFKKNYYFMMGDNRNHSRDSRYWGFLPKENIVGKAIFILYSNGRNGFKWERLLKLL